MVCASTGNTSASMAAYAAQGRPQAARAGARGQDRGRQDGAGDHARRPGDHGPRQLRRLPADGHASWPGTTRSRWSTRSTRSGSRARRPRRSRSSTSSATPPTSTCCRSATPATSRRTGSATRSTPTLGRATKRPVMRGFQAEGAAPLVTGEPFPDPETKATAIRIGNPASWKLAARPPRRVGRPVRGGQRRPDPGRPARARLPRRRVRRAGVGRRHRRAARRTWRRASRTPGRPSSSP